MFFFIFEQIFLINSFENNQKSNLYIKEEIIDGFYEGETKVVISMATTTLLSVINCTFLSNIGENIEPGAIEASGDGTIFIEKSTFENNTGTYEGGAIHLDIKVSTITDCSFINNLCYTTSESAESKGGAIFIRSKSDYEQTIKSCEFTKNIAKTAGGSIFIDFSTYSYKSSLILNCFFSESSSGQKGGGICLQYQNSINGISGETIIEGSVFISCLSDIGGCLYLSDLSNTKSDEKTINNCTFSKSNSTSHGSAIYSETNYINISNSSFLSCLAVGEGTFYIYAKLNLIEAYFLTNVVENCTSNSGGFLSIQCEHQIDSNSLVSIIDCIFNNNKAERSGGAIYSIGDLGTSITKCLFFGNTANQHGGAIYAAKNPIKVDHCLFDHCIAIENEDSKGGAIYFYQIKGETEELCTYNNFTYCQSKFSGGAIYVYCNEVENLEPDDTDSILLVKIQNCIFVQCFSEVEGGAISSGEIEMYMIKGNNDMTIESCVFMNCESCTGGALYFQDGNKEGDEKTLINGCDFNDCYATGDRKEGYAIYCRSYLIHIENCGFRQHKRGSLVQTGCIVFIEMNEPDVKPEIKSLVFEESIGVSCLIVKSMEPTIVSNLTFNNIADGSPCIDLDQWYIQKGLTIEYSNFTNIFNSRCIKSTTEIEIFSTTIESCQFINNSISKTSGNEYFNGCGSCILCLHKADLYVTSCNFTNDMSESNGGAIYAETESIGIDLCYFTLCSSAPNGEYGHGGAIYLNQTSTGGREYFILNHFFSCNASYSGGGLFIYCRDIHNTRSTRELKSDMMAYVICVIKCEFTDCISIVEGGAISSGLYNEETKSIEGDNDLQIASCNFTRCKSGKGGALFFQDGTKEGDEETTIIDCKFFECYADGDDHEGYSISCRSYQVSVQNCDFHDHHIGEFQLDTTKGCIVYIETNEVEVQPDISNLEFDNINGVSGLVIKVSSTKQVVISNLQFNNIQGVAPCIDLDLWEAKTLVQIEDSVFTNVISSRCVMSTLINHRIQVKLFKCLFENNSLFVINDVEGSDVIIKPYGGSVYLQGEAEAFISQCNFTNSISILGGGAIYAEARSIELNINRFVNCSATGNSFYKETYGGAVYLSQENEQSMTEANYERLSDNTFIDCHSIKSGGAIFVHCYDEFNRKRSTRDIDDDDHKFVVSIDYSIFTECSSEVEGGAISSGSTIEYTEGKPIIVGTNDMKIAGCTFTLCQSGRGGALFFHDGDKEGDEETVIDRCHFYENYATGETHEGYAISCRSYQITVQNCDFHDHKSSGTPTDDCIVYIDTDEPEVAPKITKLIFEDNTGVSGLIVKSKKDTTISEITFNNTQDYYLPCINLDKWDINGEVTIKDSHFTNIVEARCIMSTTETPTFSTTIENCRFINNVIRRQFSDRRVYLTGCGSCILCQHEAQVYVTNCNFTNNTAESDGGAIYAETHAIKIEFCHFVSCAAGVDYEDGKGGAIYLNQTSTDDYLRVDFYFNYFTNCNSTYSGGGLFIYCHDAHLNRKTSKDSDSMDHPVVILKCNFSECSSLVEGGAISNGIYNEDKKEIEGDNDMQVSTCNFTRCESGKGGALYFQDGTKEGDEETSITDCTFRECYATVEPHQGYAIHCRSYQINIETCYFYDHHPSDTQPPPYNRDCVVYIETNEAEVQPNIFGLIFENNNLVSGLVVNVSSKEETKISNLEFHNIKGDQPCINLDLWETNGFITILYSIFNNIDNARCIKMTRSDPTSPIIHIKIAECQFNNTIFTGISGTTEGVMPYGSSIYLQGRGEVTINLCNFTNNTAYCGGGAVYAKTQSIGLNNNRFVECSVNGKGDGDTKIGYGGAVFLNQELDETDADPDETENYEYVSGNIFTKCHSSSSGGAIFVYCHDETHHKSTRDIDDENHKYVIDILSCIFTDCSSVTEGGAISSGYFFAIDEENTILVGTNDIKVEDCTFTLCQSGRGGALFFQDGDKEGDEETVIDRCHFYENYATGETHEGYAISCRSYQITVQNCDFHDHHIGEFQLDTTKGCIVYVETNEPEVQPYISNLEFDNINGVSGLVVNVSSTEVVTVSKLQFNNIQGEAPCINLDLWEAKMFVQIEDSIFTNVISSRCVMSTINNHQIQVKLFKCQFENNSLLITDGGDGINPDIMIKPLGGSLYLQGDAEAFITQCNFTNSISILGGGAIYAEARSIELSRHLRQAKIRPKKLIFGVFFVQISMKCYITNSCSTKESQNFYLA